VALPEARLLLAAPALAAHALGARPLATGTAPDLEPAVRRVFRGDEWGPQVVPGCLPAVAVAAAALPALFVVVGGRARVAEPHEEDEAGQPACKEGQKPQEEVPREEVSRGHIGMLAASARGAGSVQPKLELLLPARNDPAGMVPHVALLLPSPAMDTQEARELVAGSEMEGLVDGLLRGLGEDPGRDGLRRTPLRVAKSLKFMTQGYGQDAESVLNGAVFESDTDEMVVVKDIELYSLCEHHMLPFFGRAHVAYLPRDKIVGLSKLARVVDVYARRLQVQERLTTQIAQAIEEALNPLGVAVLVEAQHLCMMMRGVTKQNSSTVTSCMLGQFRKDEKTRGEFLHIVSR